MDNQNNEKSIEFLGVILMTVIFLIVMSFLLPWFTSISSILKLIFTYIAVDYVKVYLKSMVEYFNNKE